MEKDKLWDNKNDQNSIFEYVLVHKLSLYPINDTTISNKIRMGFAGDTSKAANYHYIQYITISIFTISIMYCIIKNNFISIVWIITSILC